MKETILGCLPQNLILQGTCICGQSTISVFEKTKDLWFGQYDKPDHNPSIGPTHQFGMPVVLSKAVVLRNNTASPNKAVSGGTVD